MQAVSRLVLVTTYLMGMLSIGSAPVASRSDFADADTWPSFDLPPGSARLPRLAHGEPTVEPDPGPSPPTAVTSDAVVDLGQSFTLMVGETAAIDDGLSVRFEAVIGDSRCPSDVECVWEGDAEIEVEVVRPGEDPATLRMHTNPSFETEAAYLGHVVELIGLEPYPRTDSGSDEPSSATLVVNLSGVDATPTLGAG